MAAQSLGHSNSKLGDYCRKMKSRLGKAEGITATAHKLARILYAMIASKKPYDEQSAFKLTPVQHAKKIRRLLSQAQNLGFDRVPLQQPT